MGQSLSLPQSNSKDQLLYQQVCYGNVDGIKALHSQGASLEYIDGEGKTPLIAACLNPALYNVAKTLIELGANVNAYRPGSHGGTPLHHAAKRGLDHMVKLLLSHGANALLMNDDCLTPLDVSRAKGCNIIVRIIESHICLYSGWLRELYGPGFLEALAPQLLSRKVWVVAVPCGSRNLNKPFKLELAIYTSDQDAQPRTTIALWMANMEEPTSTTPDPVVIISEALTIPRRRRRRRCKPRHVSQTRVKLAPATENDRQQFQQFCSACKGIPQVMHPTFPFNTSAPIFPAAAPPAAAEVTPPDADEDMELAMALNASLQSTMQDGIPLGYAQESAETSSSFSTATSITLNSHNKPSAPTTASCIECPAEEAGPSTTSTMTSDDVIQAPTPLPSAPSVTDVVVPDEAVRYPNIDFSPVDMSGPIQDDHPVEEGGKKGGSSSSCVICFDAPVEGACVPCGHMAGCMSCLNEIMTKEWGCPVCRTKIDQIIRVYSV